MAYTEKHWLLNRRLTLPMLWLSLLLVVLASFGLTKVGLATDYKIFFDENSQDLTALEQMESKYSKTDNVFIMLRAPDSIYSPESLSVIHQLTERLWKAPHVSRVDSLTNFPYSEAVGDDIVIDNFIYEHAQIDEAHALWIAEKAPKEHDLMGSLVSEDSRYAGVNVTTLLPGLSPQQELKDVVAFVDKTVKEMERTYPQYTFYTTGVVVMNNAFVTAAKRDFVTLIPLMTLFVLAASAFILGSVPASAAILAVLLMALSAALGCAGWLGIQLSAPSISAPIIMFTVIVASSIHLISAMKRELMAGGGKGEALVNAYRHHSRPIIVSHLTTIVGFFAMNISDSPPFRDLGNIVAFGVILSLLLNFFVLPQLLLRLPISTRGMIVNRILKNLGGLSVWVIRCQKPIRLWLLPLSVALALLGVFNQPNDDLVKYFSEDVTFRSDSEKIDGQFSAIYNIGYSFDTGRANGIFEPSFLHFIERYSAWLQAQSEVVVTDGPLHRIKDLNRLLNGDSAKFYRIPGSAREAAQHFLLYEMSLPFGQDLTHQLTFDKSGLKVTARLNNMSSLSMIAFEQRAAAWLKVNIPDNVNYQSSSPALIFAHIGQSNVVSLLEGAFGAFIVISITLALVFRSLYIGALTLIPNLLPIGVAFGFWFCVNGQISMGLASVSAMAIGIIVDDTVHFLYQYVAGLKRGLTPEQSVRETFEKTMSAIVISSMLLIIGFFLLATSSFEKNAQMGMLTAATIFLALIFDLLILPAIALRFLRTISPKVKKDNTPLDSEVNYS